MQKAYDMVWCDGLWLKLSDLGVKERMWRIIKKVGEAFCKIRIGGEFR